MSLLTLSQILEIATDPSCQNAGSTTCKAEAQPSSLQGCYHWQRGSLHHDTSLVPAPTMTLSETSGNFNFAPAVKGIEISRPREKKLAILRYWYYALVSDEKNPGRLHATRNEVTARYKVC